jgi:hypothetical protein
MEGDLGGQGPMDRQQSPITTLIALATISLTFLGVGPSGADAARSKTYRVPGGGTLSVPQASISRGATVEIRRGRGPKVPASRRSVATPVNFSVRGGRLLGPVKLTLPYRRPKHSFGMPDSVNVHLAFYSSKRKAWESVPARVNPRRHTVTATIRHFSWWNPFSWDWGSILLRLDQRVGELRGARTAPAKCNAPTPTPGWADVTTNNGADLPLRTCSEGDGDKAVVQIVNNRPYGVVLRYGAPVSFGWHQMPDEVGKGLGALFADKLVSPNELYIPPLQAASVGVPRGTWFNALFQASVTPKSLAADVINLVTGGIDEKLVRPLAVGELVRDCSTVLKPKLDGSVQIDKDVVGWIETISGCILKGLPAAARAGKLDNYTLDQLQKAASILRVVSKGAQFATYAGKIADLYVGTRADLQANATFNIRRRSDPPVDPGPGPAEQPPGTPTPTPAPTPPASPSPPSTPAARQITVDNRVTNGGSAMREDNPAYLSVATRNYCKRDGCALGSTDFGSGAVLTAECTVLGDRTTNGQDNSAVDDGNPGLYQSTRWYGIRWGDGRFGYVSEVWIASQDRGGVGLRNC